MHGLQFPDGRVIVHDPEEQLYWVGRVRGKQLHLYYVLEDDELPPEFWFAAAVQEGLPLPQAAKTAREVDCAIPVTIPGPPRKGAARDAGDGYLVIWEDRPWVEG